MDLLSELSCVDGAGDLVLGLSLPPLLSVGVVAGAVLGLALPEAHADVALELDRVAVEEEKDTLRLLLTRSLQSLYRGLGVGISDVKGSVRVLL